MRAFPPAVAAVLFGALPALAGTTCNFNIECYMTEPCDGSGWELTVDREAGTLSTVFGDLDIIHVTDSGSQIAATGDGSLNLLTIGARISLFTTHVGADPATITYVGECDAE